MELLKFSKFKLQLQSLITEVRDLRDRERSATEQHRQLIQKQKRTEEECSRKIQELQGELASTKEERQKLERKVNYLQNDNVLLENKQKELKGTLTSLLQSRENFVYAYEDNAKLVNMRGRGSFCYSSCFKIFNYLSWFNLANKRSVPEFEHN
ncbi:hypothetical protein SESBI_12176 [Sesbania bispinosa]|nr:hypothetical protein SESBI_12176 [Sesbania bispinosa]